MTPPALAVIGRGRMGRLVEQLARERGWTVIAVLDAAENRGGAGITPERFAAATVAVEFTTPAAAPTNIRACARIGCPIVTGTTGWHDEWDAVERDVSAVGGSLLWSPNFSLGVNVLWEAAAMIARLVARAGAFDAHVVETHHAGKRDAPSGTARELARATGSALARDVPVTSVRTGSVPGTHELIFDGEYEQIRLTHEARDRRAFAEGALAAAAWLRGRPEGGVFTMKDLLRFDDSALT